jgi:hypothetical protein
MVEGISRSIAEKAYCNGLSVVRGGALMLDSQFVTYTSHLVVALKVKNDQTWAHKQ